MSSKVAFVALVIVLGIVNWSIVGKEKHLAEGKIVYLQLAPVDPRSLMQGDYMALQFKIANDVYNALPKNKNSTQWRQKVEANDGFVVVNLNEKRIGFFVRLYKDKALSKNETLMRYRVRGGKVKIASNAFFFQEGTGEIYQTARYGLFRIDDKGELLLASMHDNDLRKLSVDGLK